MYASTNTICLGTLAYRFRAVWRPISFSGSLVRAGFHTSTAATAPTDGVWIEIVDGVLTGRTANNSASSTTASSYTLTTAVAYVLSISVNAAGTLATYRVLNETGTQLWTDTLATNIPTGSARPVNVGLVATSPNTAVTELGVLYVMGSGTEAGFTRARG
jgi:hypothetical protein